MRKGTQKADKETGVLLVEGAVTALSLFVVVSLAYSIWRDVLDPAWPLRPISRYTMLVIGVLMALASLTVCVYLVYRMRRCVCRCKEEEDELTSVRVHLLDSKANAPRYVEIKTPSAEAVSPAG